MTISTTRLRALLVLALVSFTLLGGCASVNNPRDPFEPVNRGIYRFNDGVDTVLLKPAAEVYRAVLPQFVRTGVSNFFSNLNDVIVALNNLLQGKFLSAASDVGRIAVNTTVGLLGVIDVATHLGLEKNNEDFGQTLGYWGMGAGPYLVLPILGPSSLRDALGLIVDFKTDPVTYVDPSRDRNILWGVRLVNRRSELLETSRILETAALDPYEFVRDAYLQRRRNLVYDGNPPPEKDEDVDIRIKQRSLLDGTPLPGSVFHEGSPLLSGEELTPARREALARETPPALGRQAPAATQQPAPAAPQPGAASEPVQQPRMVRFWAPVTSR
jgi:phospholipid-binding lipoprotein MlaA